jgi:hypothetical protein
MTENRARAVEEPAGYDYAPTERIPVPGDLSENRTDDRIDNRTDAPPVDEDRTDPATPVADPTTPVEPADAPVESADTQEFPAEPVTGTAGTEKDEIERDFFDNSAIDGFRERWRELQAGFVDDPAQAVRGADDLVDEIMRELAEHKEHLAGRWRDQSDGSVGTEELRVVIREYRAFFDRLLNA